MDIRATDTAKTPQNIVVISHNPHTTEEEKNEVHERIDALLSKIFYKYID